MALELSRSRIVVTGAAGLIGRHVVRRLLQAGADVVAVDRVPLEEAPPEDAPGRLEEVTADVRDGERLRASLDGAQGVVHLASLLTYAADRHPREGVDGALGAAIDVFEAMSSVPDHRVVFASSVSVYGAADDPEHVIVEDDPLRGRLLYAISKIATELYAEGFQRSRGLSWLGLRFGTVYGPGQHREGVLPRFLHGVLDDVDAGRRPVVEFEPDAEYDLVYVEDVAECVLRSLTAPRDGLALNVVTGRSVRLEEAFGELLDAYGADATIDWQPGGSPLPARRQFGTARLAEVLGYVPDTPLRQGLEAFVAWRGRPGG